MAKVYMNTSASVVVSGLSGRANSQKLREHFETAHRNSGIDELVTFSKIGAALVEFQTPKEAADVLEDEAQLQVRGLSAVLPQDGNKRPLSGGSCYGALLKFLRSLPGLRRHTRESGRHQVSIVTFADPDMDPDACLVVSGFPDDVSPCALSFWSKYLLIFQEIGTALAEFSSRKQAAEIFANKRRLLEETGLQVRKLETLLCPKEDETPSQIQLSQLQQQLQTIKQNLNSKEEQLRQVTTVNKSLQAALRSEKEAQNVSIILSERLEQENIQLKN